MFAIVLSGAVILLSLIWTYLSQKRRNDFPPGPFGIPIFGYLPFMGDQPHIKLGEIGKKYGDIFSIFYGQYPIVILNNLQVIREAFRRDTFSGRPNHLLAMELSRDGITFNDEKAGYEQRRFTLKTLRDLGFGKQSMEKSIQDEVKELVEYFRKRTNEPVELKHVFGLFVINALWCILVGERFTVDDPKIQEIYAICIKGFIDPEVAGSLWFLPWLAKLMPQKSGYNDVVKAVEGLRELIREVIEDHKKSFIQGVPPRDFVDVYLNKIHETEDPNSSFYMEVGENNLVHVLIDLFTAGSDTLNSTLNFAIRFLAKYPEVMEKVQGEIDQVVGRCRLPDADDRKNMPYTEAVIAEVLRHSSIVCGAILHSTTEDVKFLGYFLPKGTIVMANLYNVHHDPKTWSEPEKFKPERFLRHTTTPTSQATTHGMNYEFIKNESLVPFSLGKRVCIAETMAQTEFFLFLTGLLQNFSFSFPVDEPSPDLGVCSGLVLSPIPFKVIVTERP